MKYFTATNKTLLTSLTCGLNSSSSSGLVASEGSWWWQNTKFTNRNRQKHKPVCQGSIDPVHHVKPAAAALSQSKPTSTRSQTGAESSTERGHTSYSHLTSNLDVLPSPRCRGRVGLQSTPWLRWGAEQEGCRWSTWGSRFPPHCREQKQNILYWLGRKQLFPWQTLLNLGSKWIIYSIINRCLHLRPYADVISPLHPTVKIKNYILQPNIWHTRHLIEQKTQQNWIILCKSCFFKSWIFHFITSKKNLFSSGRWTLTSEYLCPLWVLCTALHVYICTWEKNSYCIFFFSL